VLLGIRLWLRIHPKSYNCLRFRLRLGNPGSSQVFSLGGGQQVWKIISKTPKFGEKPFLLNFKKQIIKYENPGAHNHLYLRRPRRHCSPFHSAVSKRLDHAKTLRPLMHLRKSLITDIVNNNTKTYFPRSINGFTDPLKLMHTRKMSQSWAGKVLTSVNFTFSSVTSFFRCNILSARLSIYARAKAHPREKTHVNAAAHVWVRWWKIRIQYCQKSFTDRIRLRNNYVLLVPIRWSRLVYCIYTVAVSFR